MPAPSTNVINTVRINLLILLRSNSNTIDNENKKNFCI